MNQPWFLISWSFQSRCYRNLMSVGACPILSSQSNVCGERNDRPNDSSLSCLSARVQSLSWILFSMQSFHPCLESYMKGLKVKNYTMLAISTFSLLISLRAELCLAYSNSCFQVISLPALLPFSLFVKRTHEKSLPQVKIKSQKEKFYRD